LWTVTAVIRRTVPTRARRAFTAVACRTFAPPSGRRALRPPTTIRLTTFASIRTRAALGLHTFRSLDAVGLSTFTATSASTPTTITPAILLLLRAFVRHFHLDCPRPNAEQPLAAFVDNFDLHLMQFSAEIF
jgi:hypothetical protein